MKIMEKEFVKNAISEDDIGQVTPRAFFSYDYVPGVVPVVKE